MESHHSFDSLVVDELPKGVLVDGYSRLHVSVIAVGTVLAIAVVKELAALDDLLGWVMLEDAGEAERAVSSHEVLAVTIAFLEESKVVSVVTEWAAPVLLA